MPNNRTNRLVAASLITVAALAAAGCGDDQPEASHNTSKAAPEVLAGTTYQSRLPDLQAKDLVGLTANQVNMRIFTERHRLTQVGDGRVRDFGGVKFATDLLNLTKPLVPARAKEFDSYGGNFTVVAACTTREKDDEYSLHIGIIPPELATESIIGKGKNGDYRSIMERNTTCKSWGPTLPLSGMR